MIQEYLFINDTYKAEIENYKPDKVTIEFYNIENSDCWIASYSMVGDNETGAKILSEVNEYIVNKFSPTVLSNGSSAYFNRMLFPCINEFERKLRKLLYLKSALNKGDKAVENISGLESKDLGDIFTLMFTDENFIKSVKTTVNDKTWAFTKDEIIKSLNEIVENTRWNRLIGPSAVSELKNHFVIAKNYRNDTMHAHNINTKTYKDAKRLFEKINDQLDEEIGKIIKTAEEEPEKLEDSKFNTELNLAIQELDLAKQLREIVASVQSPEVISIQQQIAASRPEIAALQQQLSIDIAEANLMKRELADIIKCAQSPELITLQQQIAASQPDIAALLQQHSIDVTNSIATSHELADIIKSTKSSMTPTTQKQNSNITEVCMPAEQTNLENK